jgi:hypothetical protein
MVFLSCGHWIHMLGALRVLGATFGELEQFCYQCDTWVKIPPPKKPRKAKVVKGKDVLF